MYSRYDKKIYVLGHGRHGKDQFTEFLCQYSPGLTFTSSSLVAAEFIYKKVSSEFNYSSVEECFNDRGNNRELWYTLIKKYNSPDKTSLSRRVFTKSNIYVGLRDDEEFSACKKAGLVDIVFYVSAFARGKPIDPTMKIRYDPTMFYVDNNGTLEDLKKQANLWVKRLRLGKK